MKDNIQAVNSLDDLLHYNARVITDAEISLKTGLHAWVEKASSIKLKEVLLKYADYITRHIEKMELFFTNEQAFPLTPVNKVMHILIEETAEKMAVCSEPELKDASLLASVQEINHYKISLYGTSAAYANLLELADAGNIFHEAEISEKQIDDRLSQLAQYEINPTAKALILIGKS